MSNFSVLVWAFIAMCLLILLFCLLGGCFSKKKPPSEEDLKPYVKPVLKPLTSLDTDEPVVIERLENSYCVCVGVRKAISNEYRHYIHDYSVQEVKEWAKASGYNVLNA